MTAALISIPLPNIQDLRLHKVEEDLTIQGVSVPGLCAEFYRRDAGEYVESVGIYRVGEEEILAAWGIVGEDDCAFHTIRYREDGWSVPQPGCPDLRVMNDGERPIGLILTSKQDDPAVETDKPGISSPLRSVGYFRNVTRTRFVPCRPPSHEPQRENSQTEC